MFGPGIVGWHPRDRPPARALDGQLTGPGDHEDASILPPPVEAGAPVRVRETSRRFERWCIRARERPCLPVRWFDGAGDHDPVLGADGENPFGEGPLRDFHGAADQRGVKEV